MAAIIFPFTMELLVIVLFGLVAPGVRRDARLLDAIEDAPSPRKAGPLQSDSFYRAAKASSTISPVSATMSAHASSSGAIPTRRAIRMILTW